MAAQVPSRPLSLQRSRIQRLSRYTAVNNRLLGVFEIQCHVLAVISIVLLLWISETVLDRAMPSSTSIHDFVSVGERSDSQICVVANGIENVIALRTSTYVNILRNSITFLFKNLDFFYRKSIDSFLTGSELSIVHRGKREKDFVIVFPLSNM